MSDLTASSTSAPSASSQELDTRPSGDLAGNTVRNTFFRQENSTLSNHTLDRADAESVRPAVFATSSDSSTPAAESPQGPVIEEALKAPFVDVDAIGIQTWPIRGMQKWEGRILEVDQDIFTAELTSLDTDDKTTIITEFRTKVLEAGDGGLYPGDLFYMTARPVRIRGLLTTSYSLQIRRPGNWTPKDIDDIKERTRNRLEMLKDNVD